MSLSDITINNNGPLCIGSYKDHSQNTDDTMTSIGERVRVCKEDATLHTYKQALITSSALF